MKHPREPLTAPWGGRILPDVLIFLSRRVRPNLAAPGKIGGIDDELRAYGHDLRAGGQPVPTRHARRTGDGPARVLTLVHGGRLPVRTGPRPARDDPRDGWGDRLCV